MRSVTVLIATLFAQGAIAADIIATQADLHQAGVKVNCTAQSEGLRGGVNEDSKSIILKDGNQSLVSGKLVLAPTKEERREIDVQVEGTYKGNGTEDKDLSITLSTALGKHLVKVRGNSEVSLEVDRASYGCEISSVGK